MVRLLSLPALGALLYAATSVSALKASDDGQFNIQSPNSFGIFVAGQILPVTYQMDDSVASSFGLNVYFASTGTNATTTAIAAPADVTRDAASKLPESGSTSIYQHTVNYALPATTVAGDYQIIFESTNTKVNTTVPVTIRAAAPSSSSIASSSASPTSSAKASGDAQTDESGSGQLTVSASFLGAVIASVAAVAAF
ncbi:hypothetical protein BDA99DRAFT_526853 [Phascolomyces articulosus]|uniref:Uncharacterized protein n=1 Tax=Phascolomyces articulosus TaxID=60185 RepID=A0AAD5JYI9_9FUNG|nr:hypothetical protein BDA99DRAFT_526853 [Phascolomyces articulosus]